MNLDCGASWGNPLSNGQRNIHFLFDFFLGGWGGGGGSSVYKRNQKTERKKMICHAGETLGGRRHAAHLCFLGPKQTITFGGGRKPLRFMPCLLSSVALCHLFLSPAVYLCFFGLLRSSRCARITICVFTFSVRGCQSDVSSESRKLEKRTRKGKNPH